MPEQTFKGTCKGLSQQITGYVLRGGLTGDSAYKKVQPVEDAIRIKLEDFVTVVVRECMKTAREYPVNDVCMVPPQMQISDAIGRAFGVKL